MSIVVVVGFGFGGFEQARHSSSSLYSHYKTSLHSVYRHDVSSDIYEFMQNFYKVFPDLSTYDFYIMGESYAGMVRLACIAFCLLFAALSYL